MVCEENNNGNNNNKNSNDNYNNNDSNSAAMQLLRDCLIVVWTPLKIRDLE